MSNTKVPFTTGGPVSPQDINSPPPLPPAQSDRPYHAKRPHKKSRTGCKNCKVRKVKCNEDRPACRSCVLRKAVCVYPKPPSETPSETPSEAGEISTSVVSAKGQSSAPSSIASQSHGRAPIPFDHVSLGLATRGWHPAILASHQGEERDGREGREGRGSQLQLQQQQPQSQPQLNHPQIDSAGMRLLWFYTHTTSDSFSVDPGRLSPLDDILKVRIVQLAFEHPFLMDTLFAITSLHLQVLNQDSDTSRTLAYRARSFEGYRRAVEDGKVETFPALLANSLILTSLSSQAFREKDTKDLYILDWMVVWRGIGLMVEMMGTESLFKSGISGLFYRPPIQLDKSAASVPNQLLFMISSIPPDDIDYPYTQAYYETLKYLGSLYHNLLQGPNPIMNLRIVTFFTFLPRDFIRIAKERRPRALIIIAHFAAFLKTIEGIWWLEGVGHRSLVDLCNCIGPEWQHLLRVPLAARDVDDVLSIARILLGDENWEPPAVKVLPQEASVCLVDERGREIQWKPIEKKLVLHDSRIPGGGLHWTVGC